MISTIISYSIFVVYAIYLVVYGYKIIIRHGDAEKAVKVNYPPLKSSGLLLNDSPD